MTSCGRSGGGSPIQAHNGYIETYLNLGWIGIVAIGGMIIGTFGKISLELLTNFEFARLRLGFLFAILVYNFTEATFKGVHLVWTVFYLIAIDYPMARGPRSKRLSGTVEREDQETVLSGRVTESA